ncbi:MULTISPECIES: M15 family metallopeptidase [Cysteiniphilum]|uniref:D-alanyl-D-alanine dipeptidase n=1 Tax=Cysteiniphilum litorale TaxID=2056700 RepID=A0A8J3E9G9_9GAMM|nr:MULTISPECIES: M15 family metallopeptidase [Cysteiniphilum]GGG01230.1 D-alanyl-D-alanine dipeptidase [Cysteiniphilum litorale]
MHSEFIELAQSDPMRWDIKYSYDDNIVGRRIAGYYANKCLMAKVCYAALQQVVQRVAKHNLSLLIWDAYRPTKAVDDFWQWAQDTHDNHMQRQYYPNLSKADLFGQGYFNKTSNHCSGSTVDLTLIDQQGQTLDMGTIFDYMDPLSHPDNREVSKEAITNRTLLRQEMLNAGFEPIATEWWHFRLIDEPFANQMFDFDIV